MFFVSIRGQSPFGSSVVREREGGGTEDVRFCEGNSQL